MPDTGCGQRLTLREGAPAIKKRETDISLEIKCMYTIHNDDKDHMDCLSPILYTFC